jgi:hypothetical protein
MLTSVLKRTKEIWGNAAESAKLGARLQGSGRRGSQESPFNV